MNALTIVVTVLSATVTISAIEVTPISYGSYKNPSTCRTAEPFGATALDRTDSDGEGCTCSGSWQPQCCCPRPRPHSQLPTCTRTCTCRVPPCSGPPETEPVTYQTAAYSPWPTASTSWPGLRCSSDPSPDPCPCPAAAAAAVPAPAPEPPRCACGPSPFPRPPCRYYSARPQQPSCPSGGPRPSVSGPSPTDLAGFVSPPQRPLLLPKLIPVMLKPLSFDVHRPSVPSYGLGSGYGGPAPSLPSQCGCGCPPSSPYEEFYKFNDK